MEEKQYNARAAMLLDCARVLIKTGRHYQARPMIEEARKLIALGVETLPMVSDELRIADLEKMIN